MPNEEIQCKFIDYKTHQECSNWYPYEEGQTYCPEHRNDMHIPRTVRTTSYEEIRQLNLEVSVLEDKFKAMTRSERAQWIRDLENKIKELERTRRAATRASRNLDDLLSDEERDNLHTESRSYVPREPKPKYNKKTPEEKANGKVGFAAWAARLGYKLDAFYQMDDDERDARIAKYKAAHEKKA